MYRYFDLKVGVAADSSLSDGDERRCAAFQVKDRTAETPRILIAPTDSEREVSLNVTSGYFLCILSDYPVKVRVNGPSATHFTLTSSSTAPVNVGSPAPPQCAWMMTGIVSSVYLAPISGAGQTATVQVIVTGDPQSAYI